MTGRSSFSFGGLFFNSSSRCAGFAGGSWCESLAPEVDHEGTRFFALILMEERLGCMLTTCNFPLRCCAAPEKGSLSEVAAFPPAFATAIIQPTRETRRSRSPDRA
jgi:hypothetical protein